MSTAVVGLIGVVVGSLVTASWNFWLRAFEQRQLRRVAARAVTDSAVLARTGAYAAIEHSDPSYLRTRNLQSLIDTWAEHRVALATLPLERWDRIKLAVNVAHVGAETSMPEFNEAAGAVSARTVEVLDAAIEALAPYIGDSKGPFGWWMRRP